MAGASWEGFVIENIVAALPRSAAYGYYRSRAGAEVDLVVDLGGDLLAIEIKRSSAPKVSKGFHSACEDLRPRRRLVVHAGADDFPLPGGAEAVSLPTMLELAAR